MSRDNDPAMFLQVQLGSSRVFLTGDCRTEATQYCQVVHSTVQRAKLSKESQMIIMAGQTGPSSLRLLSESLFSQLELSHVFSALLPLVYYKCEDGVSHNNTVSVTPPPPL